MLACTNCGGRLKFNIASQDMKCESCDSHFDPYQFKEMSYGGAEESKEYDITVFKCPGCGGEIYSTDETAAGFCSYCGASTVLSTRLEKGVSPEYLIPFKLDKEQCKDIYAKHMKRAFFTPAKFKSRNKIDGFRGIYMPYWVYDISDRERFCVKTSESHRSGDYIITDHYNNVGTLDCTYYGASYDGSSSFADEISSEIAPYTAKNIKHFTPSFLSGFYADIADVPSDVYVDSAKNLASTSSAKFIMEQKGIKGRSVEGGREAIEKQLNPHIDNTHSAMFPVWFLSYRNGNRVAYATVNGETGKVSADMPISIGRYLLISLVVAIPLFFLLNAFVTLIPKMLCMLTAIMGLVAIILYNNEMKKILKKDTGEDDVGYMYRVEQKQKDRMKRQQSAVFENEGGAIVVSDNDVKRAKVRAKKEKKNRKSGISLFSVVVISIIVLSFAKSFLQPLMSSFSGGSGYAIVTFVTLVIDVIIVISTFGKVKQIEDKKGIPLSLITAIATAIMLILLVIAPASDIFYYVMVIITMIAILVNLIDLIASYNLMATRKLPQFDRYTGGDDRA